MRVYTIGHSTRSLDELIRLLRDNGVERLADIRRFPGSRKFPHFAHESLSRELPEHGIEYVHIPQLGGRRTETHDSPHTSLRNAQFRGYADHMLTAAFQEGMDRLLDSDKTTAIMCAEAVPWRCHRNFVSDELVRRGIDVVHILGIGSRRRHELNPIVHVEGDRLIYNG